MFVFCIPAGGISVICQNLVNCNCRIISTNPSLISTIMQNLNGRSRIEKKNSDFESPDGLQNFAPLGNWLQIIPHYVHGQCHEAVLLSVFHCV